MSKTGKRVLILIAVILVLALIAGFVVGNFMYNLSLNPHADRSAVFGAPHNSMAGDTQVDEAARRARNDEYEAWAESVGHDDWYMTSHDGLRLHAYARPLHPQGGKWAILCHGYSGNGSQMTIAGKHFADAGYNLLAPDCRGHGQSEGAYIGMGWHDRLDIVSWIDEILKVDPQAQIVLFGVSMGGATVMMTSGEPLPDNVRAIVEDCGYTSAWDEFAYQLRQLFGLPAFPVMHFATMVTRLRAGYWLGEASAVAQVAKTDKPILFIHGDADTFVPSSMVYEVYEAAAGPKELFVVKGAGHGSASSVAGDLYWDTVWAFIDRYVE